MTDQEKIKEARRQYARDYYSDPVKGAERRRKRREAIRRYYLRKFEKMQKEGSQEAREVEEDDR